MRIKNFSIPQGQAKIEITAHQTEIAAYLKKGFSYIRIYRELFNQKKITMKYGAFVYHIKKLYPELKKQNNKKKIKPNTQQNFLPQENNLQNNQRPPKINHRPDLDEKDKFMPHGYDPVGEKPTENKKEEENKGDNK